MADAHAELPWHAPTALVSLAVELLSGLVECVWVEGLCDDPAPRRRDMCQPRQKTTRTSARAEHPEVLAEKDDRVELAHRRIDRVDREHSCVSHASSQAALDRSRRRIDADDLESTLL